jgi:hypothetical protein
MSSGSGRIERAIEQLFIAHPDDAFTTEELCEHIYSADEKKHRVAVVRAAFNFINRDARFGLFAWRNHKHAYFNKHSVMSYALARLKADEMTRYRSKRAHHFVTTEDDLKARLQKGGNHYEFVIKGGAWWQHVQWWRAEYEAIRDGDNERLERIDAERKATRDENRDYRPRANPMIISTRIVPQSLHKPRSQPRTRAERESS